MDVSDVSVYCFAVKSTAVWLLYFVKVGWYKINLCSLLKCCNGKEIWLGAGLEATDKLTNNSLDETLSMIRIVEYNTTQLVAIAEAIDVTGRQ